jgi:hypothetical protein
VAVSWAQWLQKAGGIEIRPLSQHQNWSLENAHIKTAMLVKFAQKILY